MSWFCLLEPHITPRKTWAETSRQSLLIMGAAVVSCRPAIELAKLSACGSIAAYRRRKSRSFCRDLAPRNDHHSRDMDRHPPTQKAFSDEISKRRARRKASSGHDAPSAAPMQNPRARAGLEGRYLSVASRWHPQNPTELTC